MKMCEKEKSNRKMQKETNNLTMKEDENNEKKKKIKTKLQIDRISKKAFQSRHWERTCKKRELQRNESTDEQTNVRKIFQK